jgi:hypothetical protein
MSCSTTSTATRSLLESGICGEEHASRESGIGKEREKARIHLLDNWGNKGRHQLIPSEFGQRATDTGNNDQN